MTAPHSQSETILPTDGKGMEFTFHNCQRILTRNPTINMTLMGFLITIDIAGVGAVKYLYDMRNKADTLFALSTVLAIVVSLLTIIWWREHSLFKATLRLLGNFPEYYGERNQIVFPEKHDAAQNDTDWAIGNAIVLSLVFWWSLSFLTMICSVLALPFRLR